jgi:TRAP-type C4-dicarboxylate transport system permease small subunit
MRKDIAKRLIDGYKLFCAFILGLSAALLIAVIILRETVGISYDFMIDIIVWLTVWATFLLSGPLYGERGHVAIKFVLEKLSGKPRLGLEFFNALCALTYVGVTTVGGVLLMHTLYSQHQVYPRYIAIPMWIVQMCVPIGLCIFTIFALVELYRIVQRMRALRPADQ